jgi:hypothetical protein
MGPASRIARRDNRGNIMDGRLTDIELLVIKLDLEQKRLQLLEKKRAAQQRHSVAQLRAVELLIEKLRLEKMQETLQHRREFEGSRQVGRTGFIRAL